MKPKILIILASFAALMLAVGILHFGQPQTQAAAQDRVQVISSGRGDTDGFDGDGGIHLWLIRGTAPAGGYLSCRIVYADGRVETVPLDGCYKLDDRYHFLVSLFPSTGDWGATVRLAYHHLDQAEPGSDRELVLEKVAPQLPADRPAEGFIWRGEELPGCNVWRWEINL
ncbi:hypothetical protein KAU45_00380 [bacterium]|nr:hypothetical protein [bacterium]